jgi:hypothetical protein
METSSASVARKINSKCVPMITQRIEEDEKMENNNLFMTLIAFADERGDLFEAHHYGDFMVAKAKTKDGKILSFSIDIKEEEKDD